MPVPLVDCRFAVSDISKSWADGAAEAAEAAEVVGRYADADASSVPAAFAGVKSAGLCSGAVTRVSHTAALDALAFGTSFLFPYFDTVGRLHTGMGEGGEGRGREGREDVD